MTTKYLPWGVIGGIGLFAMTFIYWRGPDQNWDLFNYHYYAGYALIYGRFSIDIAAASLQTFLNPLPNLLTFGVLSHFSFPFNAWIILGVQLLSLPLVLLIFQEMDHDFFSDKANMSGILGLLLSILAPLWWSELGTSFFDATLTPVVYVGLLFGLRGIARATALQLPWSSLAIAGFAIGLAAGLKLTNAIFAVGLILAMIPLWSYSNIWRAVQYGIICTVGLAAGFAATSWWNVALARQWGSPFFPFYNALFQSPYFEPINFRDLRWKFHSFSEFFGFFKDAAFGTNKTSEFAFADVRLLIILLLFGTLTLAWVYRRILSKARRVHCPEDIVRKAFLWFFCASFALWALFFAYQRYMIPLELLAGIVIWVIGRELLRDGRAVSWLLAICITLSLMTISVPDWGHKKPPISSLPNHFGLQLPSALVNQPADYLVTDVPNSYIFPFMHHDSRFLRVDFTPKIDGLIRQVLAQNTTRPVRVLSREATAATVLDKWARFGFLPGSRPWHCWYFRSDIDSYVVCEVGAALGEEGLRPNGYNLFQNLLAKVT